MAYALVAPFSAVCHDGAHTDVPRRFGVSIDQFLRAPTGTMVRV